MHFLWSAYTTPPVRRRLFHCILPCSHLPLVGIAHRTWILEKQVEELLLGEERRREGWVINAEHVVESERRREPELVDKGGHDFGIIF